MIGNTYTLYDSTIVQDSIMLMFSYNPYSFLTYEKSLPSRYLAIHTTNLCNETNMRFVVNEIVSEKCVVVPFSQEN